MNHDCIPSFDERVRMLCSCCFSFLVLCSSCFCCFLVPLLQTIHITLQQVSISLGRKTCHCSCPGPFICPSYAQHPHQLWSLLLCHEYWCGCTTISYYLCSVPRIGGIEQNALQGSPMNRSCRTCTYMGQSFFCHLTKPYYSVAG